MTPPIKLQTTTDSFQSLVDAVHDTHMHCVQTEMKLTKCKQDNHKLVAVFSELIRATTVDDNGKTIIDLSTINKHVMAEIHKLVEVL